MYSIGFIGQCYLILLFARYQGKSIYFGQYVLVFFHGQIESFLLSIVIDNLQLASTFVDGICSFEKIFIIWVSRGSSDSIIWIELNGNRIRYFDDIAVQEQKIEKQWVVKVR